MGEVSWKFRENTHFSTVAASTVIIFKKWVFSELYV